MALVPCKECNKEISTLAKTCPNCGAPNSSNINNNPSSSSPSEWTQDDDNKLLSLDKKNVPEFALAKILKKRLTEIRARIIILMKK
jgi:predicted amidophosphoribosyltransferase